MKLRVLYARAVDLLKLSYFAKVFWSASLSRNFGYVGMGMHFGFPRQKKRNSDRSLWSRSVEKKRTLKGIST